MLEKLEKESERYMFADENSVAILVQNHRTIKKFRKKISSVAVCL